MTARGLIESARTEAERRYADRGEVPLGPGAIRNARCEAFENGAAWAAQQVANEKGTGDTSAEAR